MFWLIPSFYHEKAVYFRLDPHNLYSLLGPTRRFWIFRFRLEGNSLFVNGRPTLGEGEASAYFSFHLQIKREKAPLRVETLLEVLPACTFKMTVHDIYTTVKGAHIGSYIFNKVLKFIQLTVGFCGEAEVRGTLGYVNEVTPDRRNRRRLFWESFGVKVLEEEHRIEGDLKWIVKNQIKDLPDVEELSWEDALKFSERFSS